MTGYLLVRCKNSGLAYRKNTKKVVPRRMDYEIPRQKFVSFTNIIFVHEESKIHKKSEAREKLEPMLLDNIAL